MQRWEPLAFVIALAVAWPSGSWLEQAIALLIMCVVIYYQFRVLQHERRR